MSFPILQFHKRDGRVLVKPGLVDSCAVLLAPPEGVPRDPWSVAITARTSAPELDGLTPEQWATQDRDTETLVMHTHRLRAHLAH